MNFVISFQSSFENSLGWMKDVYQELYVSADFLPFAEASSWEDIKCLAH